MGQVQSKARLPICPEKMPETKNFLSLWQKVEKSMYWWVGLGNWQLWLGIDHLTWSKNSTYLHNMLKFRNYNHSKRIMVPKFFQWQDTAFLNFWNYKETGSDYSDDNRADKPSRADPSFGIIRGCPRCLLISLNCKKYLSNLQIVFVQIAKCICLLRCKTNDWCQWCLKCGQCWDLGVCRRYRKYRKCKLVKKRIDTRMAPAYARMGKVGK